MWPNANASRHTCSMCSNGHAAGRVHMAVYACSRPCGRPCMWPNMHTATCACSRTQIQPMHACGRTCTWQFVRMAERACGRQLVSAEQETNNRTRPRADAHSAEWKVTTHVFVDQSVTLSGIRICKRCNRNCPSVPESQPINQGSMGRQKYSRFAHPEVRTRVRDAIHTY